MPRILIFADWYLPGNKGGGAVSAISNLVELLGDAFEFYVFTRNRDSTEEGPYAGICFNQWLPTGKASVFYASELSLRTIRRCILGVAPQVIYLNSFFSRLTMKVLLLRQCGMLPRSAVVLAPRGEFSPGALGLKSFRKLLYRKVAFGLGLHRNLVWQASSTLEEEHIRSSSSRSGSPDETNILVAPDVPTANLASHPYFPQMPRKKSGSARFVFLSRISPMKNLHFALGLLGSTWGDIELDIYGPIEDPIYWEQCQERIRQLPARVRVNYKGAASPNQVVQIFSQYHFQILPTLGENFGYVILEAFAGGCPVLISDQTPWRDLAPSGAGWDVPLADTQQWIDVLRRCIEMDQETYALMSQRSRSYFEQWLADSPYLANTQKLFQTALERQRILEVRQALEKPAGAGD